jgi:threonine dehydratase
MITPMEKLEVFPIEWIIQAEGRIAPHIHVTPLTHDKDRGIFLKWENRQVTGSFKARGAFNKILSLEPWEQQQGIVGASAGNHGQGVALAGRQVGAQVTVFASQQASPFKIEKMRSLGADVRLVAGGYEQAEVEGFKYAKENNKTWVSPYNDPQVIAGQGTIGLEISQQMKLTSSLNVLVPVSGGGLLAGVAAAFSHAKDRPRVVGVQAEASAFMHALYKKGSQENVSDLPTLADGLSGPVENGSITVPLIKALVDDILLVSEEEIARAISYAYHFYGETIEASAAVGLAAILSGIIQSPAVVVISGGNILPELHAQVCDRFKDGN